MSTERDRAAELIGKLYNQARADGVVEPRVDIYILHHLLALLLIRLTEGTRQ